MGKRRQLHPQSVWDEEAVKQAFAAAGAKLHHVGRLYTHLCHHPGSTWADVAGLPRAAVAALDAGFAMHTTRLLHAQRSSDGSTTKLLVQLQDGLQVEAVIMEYDNTERYEGGEEAGQPDSSGADVAGATVPGTAGQAPAAAATAEPGPPEEQRGAAAAGGCCFDDQNDDDDDEEEEEEEDAEFHDAASSLGEYFGGKQRGGRRTTLCVSSEVGCSMGCTFCATGTMGFIADLTAGEIVEQLVYANAVSRVRNIVFMGMGEPLNNYAAVKSAVGMMTDSRYFSLKRKKVTVSTVGVIPRLLQMADDMPGVSLALSLHAPTQELRQTIVPSAKAFKLDKLMAALDEYQRRTQQRVFVEYVLLGPDVNCTEAHAHELGQLLSGRDVLINIIPWNPILSPSMTFAAPHSGATAAFHQILRYHYNLSCTIRQEKGQDISGACGQLVLEHGGRLPTGGGAAGGGGACSSGGKLADLEDLLPAPVQQQPQAAAVAAR